MEGSKEMRPIGRQTAVRPLYSTGKIERVTCERCFTGEARYRVFSDIINMKVCASCAKMARELATFTDGDSLTDQILTGEIAIRLWPDLRRA